MHWKRIFLIIETQKYLKCPRTASYHLVEKHPPIHSAFIDAFFLFFILWSSSAISTTSLVVGAGPNISMAKRTFHPNAAHSAAVWVINTLILPFKTLNNRRHDFSACWHSNPRERPLFPAILEQLERIRQSEFTRAPHESFHTMQDGWRLEIEEVLRDLRRKEKVWIVEKFISSYW